MVAVPHQEDILKRVALIALAAVAVLAVLGVGIGQALQDSGSGGTTTTASAERRFSVAEAGAVTITVQSGRISVISIQRVEGWEPKVVRQSGPNVRVDFVKGAARRVFVARFAAGELVTQVRRLGSQSTSSSVSSSSVTSSSVTSSTGATSSTVDDDSTSTTLDDHTSTTIDDDGTSTTIDDDHTSTTFDDDHTSTTFDDDHTSTTFDDDHTGTTVREETPSADRSVTYQVADAGTVTVMISGGQLTLLDVGANAGWSFEVEDAGGDRVRVEFDNGDDDVEFRLQFHGSELRVEIG
jgi:hypothetical protein